MIDGLICHNIARDVPGFSAFGDAELRTRLRLIGPVQESTLQVRACYHRFGLLPEEYPRVADDSLALELGFMAELARRAADAFGAGDAETLDAALRGARDFLKEHLLVWVPLLAERAGKTGTAPLYPQLLRILDSFLKQDRETLNDLLSEGVHAHD